MKTGKFYIMIALSIWALTGCGTMPGQADRPILSAAAADTMIRVEVTPIQPAAVSEAIVAAAR